VRLLAFRFVATALCDALALPPSLAAALTLVPPPPRPAAESAELAAAAAETVLHAAAEADAARGAAAASTAARAAAEADAECAVDDGGGALAPALDVSGNGGGVEDFGGAVPRATLGGVCALLRTLLCAAAVYALAAAARPLFAGVALHVAVVALAKNRAAGAAAAALASPLVSPTKRSWRTREDEPEVTDDAAAAPTGRCSTPRPGASASSSPPRSRSRRRPLRRLLPGRTLRW
jgi:hypothetical protein